MPADRTRMSKIEKPKPVSELVLERLRKDIIENRFDLGEKVSESQLSDLYGVTKAPIRSASIRLETEGLLVVRPQSGTYVFQPSSDELKALCELRTALELEAMQLAMKRNPEALNEAISANYEEMVEALADGDQNRYQQLDSAFHMIIVAQAESPLLFSTYDSRVNGRFSALRYRFSQNDEFNHHSLREHKQMRDLIREKKVAKTVALLRKHIDYTDNYYRGTLASQSG